MPNQRTIAGEGTVRVNKTPEYILAKNRAYRKRNWKKVYAKQLEWQRANRDKTNAANKRTRDKYRKLILNHYGNECECCQEDIQEFLELDHVNGNGNTH